MTSTIVDGRRLWLRLLEPTDANLIRLFFWRLSAESLYRRFLSPIKPPANTLVARLVDIDHCSREALIALDEHGIVGIARYGTLGSRHDVAVVVADEWQGRGVGALLLRRLANIARARGITSFQATMLGDNRRAQRLVLGLSSKTRIRFDAGYLEADIPLGARHAS
ncbi:MAG TPA: GNAT family N-acetyltransferase [Candidatus Dormibacteraeota bacterium]|nr:GNAT family N-acetyltransferase [Candidatus Dormibacteraeota bacterium]